MQTTCTTRRGGTASSGAVRALCVAALAAAVAASGGCGSRRSAPSESAPSAPVPAPAPAQAQAPGAPPSSATNLDDYKREVALHIHRLAASQVFEGRPPSLLRSVIVASLLVDGSGNLAGVRILRDNGDAETVAAVHESMRRAARLFRARPAGCCAAGALSSPKPGWYAKTPSFNCARLRMPGSSNNESFAPIGIDGA